MTQNNFKIAVTGGIGSGKSAVMEIVKELGFATLSCDEIYAELMESEDYIKAISNTFGDVLTDDGRIDRRKLSSTVFSDLDKLKKLNEISHRLIMGEVIRRSENFKVSFCEVPLLFEGGYERLFDAIIVVLRDKEERIKSVIKRNGLTRKEVILRLNSQYNYDNCDFSEYYVIHNSGNLDDLKTVTRKIVEKILN